jgi:hypothetical protein
MSAVFVDTNLYEKFSAETEFCEIGPWPSWPRCWSGSSGSTLYRATRTRFRRTWPSPPGRVLGSSFETFSGLFFLLQIFSATLFTVWRCCSILFFLTLASWKPGQTRWLMMRIRVLSSSWRDSRVTLSEKFRVSKKQDFSLLQICNIF